MQRQRLPRGRSGATKGKEGALKARISRLEAIVLQLQGRPPNGLPNNLPGLEQFTPPDMEVDSDIPKPLESAPAPVRKETSTSPASERLNRFIAPTFWGELSDAV